MSVPAPFYNAVKGTTAGTPGTGAFTPNAASAGFRAWSNVPTGWIGLVRYEDGSAWELSYSYWNGTTLSRGTNQRVESSTGSILTLTSSSTASLIVDGAEIMSHLGGTSWRGNWAMPGGTSITSLGSGGPTAQGTAASQTLATTNFLTHQPRLQYTSATTANAHAGWSQSIAWGVYSTTAGSGGFEFVARFGPTQLPTGPKLFVGTSSTGFGGISSEPSAHNANTAAFAKDSTDTNIQLLTKTAGGSNTKTDTGITLTANGWYEASVWVEPGGGRVYGLLIRLDTGEIWYGSSTTNLPANGALMIANLIGGLSATTGTAFIMQVGGLMMRGGA